MTKQNIPEAAAQPAPRLFPCNACGARPHEKHVEGCVNGPDGMITALEQQDRRAGDVPSFDAGQEIADAIDARVLEDALAPSLTIVNQPIDPAVTFMSDGGEPCGKLHYDKDKRALVFEGDLDESARQLARFAAAHFQSIINGNRDGLADVDPCTDDMVRASIPGFEYDVCADAIVDPESNAMLDYHVLKAIFAASVGKRDPIVVSKDSAIASGLKYSSES